jgi:hypothetical protein
MKTDTVKKIKRFLKGRMVIKIFLQDINNPFLDALQLIFSQLLVKKFFLIAKSMSGIGTHSG